MKSKAIILLLALLEGMPNESVLQRICSSLDFDVLKERIVQVFWNFVNEELNLDPEKVSYGEIKEKLRQKCTLEGSVEEGFNIYIAFQKMQDLYP